MIVFVTANVAANESSLTFSDIDYLAPQCLLGIIWS